MTWASGQPTRLKLRLRRKPNQGHGRITNHQQHRVHGCALWIWQQGMLPDGSMLQPRWVVWVSEELGLALVALMLYWRIAPSDWLRQHAWVMPLGLGGVLA